MVDRVEWAGILGFAVLFGAFFGLVLTVGLFYGPPVEPGAGSLADYVLGIVVGIVVFGALAVAYMFTLATDVVERDELIPGWG